MALTPRRGNTTDETWETIGRHPKPGVWPQYGKKGYCVSRQLWAQYIEELVQRCLAVRAIETGLTAWGWGRW